MSLALLSLLLAIDPCAPIERAAPEPELAEVYARVAAEEERRGAEAASAAAWRRAAELQPEGGPAQLALQRLCARATATAAFEQGQQLFDNRDCRAALPLLRQARRGPDAAPAALLEGICAWELGDDSAAIEALKVSLADPQLAASAELFLGLLALRQGDNREALAHIGAAARSDSEPLSSTAAQLLRLADRRQRLVIEAAAEAGYDSNATLSAGRGLLPGAANDGFAAGTATLTFRPSADAGPYLLVGGGYRKQVGYPQSDVGLGTGTLGWQLKLGLVRGALDYGLDFVALGAEPWMLRQRGTVRVLLPLGAVGLSAEYGLRHEALWEESVKADSGLRHLGRAAASLRLGDQLLELSGLVLRASAKTRDRSSLEAGGELRWVVRPLARLDLEAGFGARWRRFDAVDEELLVRREELQLDAQLGADLELTPSLGLFVALEYRRVASSVGELTYSRLGASAGLRVWLGVW